MCWAVDKILFLMLIERIHSSPTVISDTLIPEMCFIMLSKTSQIIHFKNAKAIH